MDLLEAIMEELQLVQFVIKEAFWFLLCGGLTFGAILVDLSTGVSRARALKEKIYSGGLRKSFIKLRDYLSIFYFGVIVDIALNLVWKYMPIGLIATCISASAIELISVVENLKLKKSSAAKMPEIISKIVEVKDAEGAAKVIRELQNMSKKSGNKK
jgi:hypothetical protein